MKAWSGMGQRLARHQGTLSTSAHAEYGHDQAMGPPCYPDEGCFLAMDGSALFWTTQMPFWAKSLRGEACPTMKLRWQP
jgi:hypothetical protein